jgi:hypothetical protein
MDVITVLTVDVIGRALVDAEAIPMLPSGPGDQCFPGPGNPRLQLALEKLWEKIKDGVMACFRKFSTRSATMTMQTIATS